MMWNGSIPWYGSHQTIMPTSTAVAITVPTPTRVSAQHRNQRVLAIADAFDAMTSNRPYRMALTQDEAFRELRDGAGTQFDPDMVESFIHMIERGSLRYGALVRMTDEEARELAEQRGWVYRD